MLSSERDETQLVHAPIKRKPPLYLNLSDFRLMVDIIEELATKCEPELYLTTDEIQLKLKIQTIISYIERARLRSRGDSHAIPQK